jgi:protein-disulfide isomerase
MKVRIQIQHFNDCPNSPILIDRVKLAIKDFENVGFSEVIVDTNEKAEKLGFRGSPTLLINGEDFENQTSPEKPFLSCRYYPGGLPTVDEIRSKILSIL